MILDKSDVLVQVYYVLFHIYAHLSLKCCFKTSGFGLLVLGSKTSAIVSLLEGGKGTLLMTLSVVGIFGLGVALLVAAVLLTDMTARMPTAALVCCH